MTTTTDYTILDLTGSGGTTRKLDLASVLAMTETVSGTSTLLVRKDPDDRVEFTDSGWQLAGMQDLNGTLHFVYENGDVRTLMEGVSSTSFHTSDSWSLFAGTESQDQIVGTSRRDTFLFIANGDAVFADEGDDWIWIEGADAFVDGGSGHDEVQLYGQDFTLDLSNGQSRLSSVEVINMRLSIDHTLILDHAAVLATSTEKDGITTLDILKDRRDTVQFADAGWKYDGRQSAILHDYMVFSKDDARVRIEAEDAQSHYVGAGNLTEFLLGSALSDTIEGLNSDDFLHAGAGDDIVHLDHTDVNARARGQINGGEGIDTLVLSGAHTDDGQLQIAQSFEVIDMSELRWLGLNANDVKALSDHREDGVAILTIEADLDVRGLAIDARYGDDMDVFGDDMDVLLRDGFWDWQGQVSEYGLTYNVFERDGAQVRIQDGLELYANALRGTNGRDHLYGTLTDDVFTNIGSQDWMLGLRGDDTFHITSTDFKYVWGGRGYNRIVLDGQDMTLDYTGNRGYRARLQEIDLTGSGANTLVLDGQGAKTVATLLEGDFIYTRSSDLHVLGGGDDTLQLTDGGWVDKGFVYKTTKSGESYFRELENDGQTLFVKSSVTIDFQDRTVDNTGDDIFVVTATDGPINAGAGDDRFMLISNTFDEIDGGADYDVLEIGSSDKHLTHRFVLELDETAGQSLKSIEEIDMTQHGNTGVRLTEQSVLALSDNVDSQGVTSLKIRGDDGNHVFLKMPVGSFLERLQAPMSRSMSMRRTVQESWSKARLRSGRPPLSGRSVSR